MQVLKQISQSHRQGTPAISDQPSTISPAFQTLASEAPQQAQAWAEAAQVLGQASALDPKTQALAYLAVLAALRLEIGVPFHVKTAKQLGRRARK